MSAYEIVKTETVDLGAEAARLENFELSLARQECETLRAELQQLKRDHVDEISSLKHQAAIDPVAEVFRMLDAYPGLESDLKNALIKIKDLDKALAVVTESNTTLAELNESLLASTEIAAVQRDTAVDRMNRLMVEIDGLKSAVRSRDAELKELRALNPKKLKSQVKTLQNRNRELVEMDARNKAAFREQGGSVFKGEGWSIHRFTSPAPFLVLFHPVTGSMKILYSPGVDSVTPALPSSVYDKSTELLERLILKGGA